MKSTRTKIRSQFAGSGIRFTELVPVLAEAIYYSAARGVIADKEAVSEAARKLEACTPRPTPKWKDAEIEYFETRIKAFLKSYHNCE